MALGVVRSVARHTDVDLADVPIADVIEFAVSWRGKSLHRLPIIFAPVAVDSARIDDVAFGIADAVACGACDWRRGMRHFFHTSRMASQKCAPPLAEGSAWQRLSRDFDQQPWAGWGTEPEALQKSCPARHHGLSGVLSASLNLSV